MINLRPATPWVCARCQAQDPSRWTREARRAFRASRSTNSTATATVVEDAATEHGIPPQSQSVSHSEKPKDALSSETSPLRYYIHGYRHSYFPRTQQQHLDTLRAALKDSDARSILQLLALPAPENAQDDFLRRVPLATWTQMLKLVTSSALKPALHRVHRLHRPKDLRRIGYAHELEQYEAVQRLVQIATVRKDKEIALGLVDYRLLLQSAASLGDGESARRIWVEMKRDRVLPDVGCYNLYLTAMLYDESARLLQTAKAKDTKEQVRPRVAPIMVFNKSAVADVRDVYNEMLTRRVAPDATTVSLLMVASAREGKDLSEVSNMIAHFWGVDMRSLASAETPSPPTVALDPTSPLYPTPRVLAAVAEAFGSQNEIPLALRLIDYFNEHHAVPIKRNTWHTLLHWLWMQTRAQTNPHPEPLHDSYARVLDFARMKLAATRASPFDELHMLFRTLLEADKWNSARLLQVMEHGRMAYLDTARRCAGAARSVARIERYARATRDGRRLVRARRLAGRLLLERNRQHHVLRRWARAVTKRWNHTKNADGEAHPRAAAMREWQVRTLPKFVRVWRRFFGRVVVYRVETGNVEIVLRSDEERMSKAMRGRGGNDGTRLTKGTRARSRRKVLVKGGLSGALNGW